MNESKEGIRFVFMHWYKCTPMNKTNWGVARDNSSVSYFLDDVINLKTIFLAFDVMALTFLKWKFSPRLSLIKS